MRTSPFFPALLKICRSQESIEKYWEGENKGGKGLRYHLVIAELGMREISSILNRLTIEEPNREIDFLAGEIERLYGVCEEATQEIEAIISSIVDEDDELFEEYHQIYLDEDEEEEKYEYNIADFKPLSKLKDEITATIKKLQELGKFDDFLHLAKKARWGAAKATKTIKLFKGEVLYLELTKEYLEELIQIIEELKQ